MSEETGKEVKKEEDVKEEEKKETSKKTMFFTCTPKLKRDVSVIVVLVILLGVGYLWSAGKLSFFYGASSSKELKKVDAVNVESVDQFSYAAGTAIAQQISMTIDQAQAQGEEINREILSQALRDVLTGNENVPMSEEQIEEMFTKKQEQAQAEFEASAEKNKEEGEAFLASYKEKEGVKEIENGVLYTVIESGTGPVVGKQTALVQYEGRLVDGTVFDSSEQNGGESVAFSEGQVIPGFWGAISQMRVGDKWEIVIPSDQAYGANGSGQLIGPNATIVFTVKVTDVEPAL